MFDAINIVKNNVIEKSVYSGYGIVFDGAGKWSFYNDSAEIVIMFGIDNSSSSHSEKITEKIWRNMGTTVLVTGCE